MRQLGSDGMLTYFGRNTAGSGKSEAGAPRPALSPEGLATLQSVRGYWEALRQNGSVPRRDQIDPRGLAAALDKVFLVERIAAGQARFRLAGMQLNDLMAMDVRGMPLSALFDPAARARLAAELEQLFDAPSVLEIWLEAERGVGRPALSARMLLLPLIGSGGEPGLALGCVAAEGSLGRAPRRFAIAGMVRELIAQPALRVVPEVAPLPTPPRSLGKPVLRLVSSRD